ncbi:MAG: HD domain-containing protein [Candidatus Paceibacterota bacterium]|jgi:poly(A) polymerase/tRNA nucleotidyltransferase (CCA-adding enzyme)|nr:CCA tRNA nucleotidyltransferase [bacterium]
MHSKENISIPNNVFFCLDILNKKNFKAYIVGGSVRDYLNGKNPADWDIATNATPEEVQSIFEKENVKTFYENDFGTVGVAFRVPRETLDEEEYDIVEITTFRSESSYSNSRHPDKVEWSKTIEEDLTRRDFTVNAIALYPTNNKESTIIDPFNGRADLSKKIIRAVGNPDKRFSEDALRMMRAIRFETSLGEGWTIENDTKLAIIKNANLLQKISHERLRDELIKIINSNKAAEGIESLRRNGLLKYIIPELEQGYKIAQNKHHVFDCYQHNLEALAYSTKRDFSFYIRMASLLHDIGKPATKAGEGENATFYNHEIIGAKMTKTILTRLHFPKKDNERITSLVRYHLFYYNIDEVKEASIRRLIKNIGVENVEDLLKLRMADRVGSGCPKAEPYKLRHLKYMIEKVSKGPISVKMLKINGTDIMELFRLKPSPRVGWLLEVLLEEILKDPSKNSREALLKRLNALSSLSDEDLKKLSLQAKEEVGEIRSDEDKRTKKKYWVQ